jgi:hypothetical protein
MESLVLEAERLKSIFVNFSWRKDLLGLKLIVWNEMLPRIANITLTSELDKQKAMESKSAT